MLNSAQHARSAASRLSVDDVIDRSALEQAREGLPGIRRPGYRGAAHLDQQSKKSTLVGGQPFVTTQL